MKQRGALVRGLVSLSVGVLLFGSAAPARAAESFAIIANLTGAPKPHAHLDVGVDTSASGGVPVAVEFTIFNARGALLDQFVVMTAPETGFASTASAFPPNDNLFTTSAGLPAPVRIRSPQPVGTEATVLRQSLGKSRIILGVPVAKRSDGTALAQGRTFRTTGDIIQKATLLVANVSGGDVAVDVFVGAKGVPGHGKYTNPALNNMSLWIVELDPTDARSHLVVASGGHIVVQLAVEDGQKGTVTEVTVLPVN